MSNTAIASAFKIWRSVEIGIPPVSADDFRKDIRSAGMQISDNADKCLSSPDFRVNGTRETVDLVRISVGEIVQESSATGSEFFKKTQEVGLRFCPNEIGPRLRRLLTDQPKDELLFIGMLPMAFPCDNLKIFGVANIQGILSLGGYDYKPNRSYPGFTNFVLVKPRE
jgi:hypothetical protein